MRKLKRSSENRMVVGLIFEYCSLIDNVCFNSHFSFLIQHDLEGAVAQEFSDFYPFLLGGGKFLIS